MSTVHHQAYLNTVYTQHVFVVLVLLVSVSVVILTANRTSMYSCVSNVEILLMMDSQTVRNMQSKL